RLPDGAHAAAVTYSSRVSRCICEPSGLIANSSGSYSFEGRAHVMRIRAPFGDQSDTSSSAFVCVTWCLFEPFAFIAQTWKTCEPAACEYAIVNPSGDHAGSMFRYVRFVRARRPVPSRPITQIADPGSLREQANARRVPLGDQVGSAASMVAGVSRRTDDPDAVVTKTARWPVPSSRVNATIEPSGDQTGSESETRPEVSR